MARFAAPIILALLLPFMGSAVEVTPVQKLVQMLDGMLSKGKSEKNEEEVEFAKFAQWCDSTKAAKTKAIQEAADQIVQLAADIEKANSDAETLASEIEVLEADTAKWEGEYKAAKGIRAKEHSDFSAAHKDFSESIDACGRAEQVLKAKQGDVAQSLLQIQNSAMVPAREKAVLESFLAMSNSAEAGAPEANAYEFQSSSVVDMLRKLRLKFEDQRLALEKEELSAKSNYEVLAQQLTDDILAAKAAVSKKTSTKAARLEAAATAKTDLATTETTKADDENTLSDTNTECDVNSREYEKNQVVRSDEIRAIEKATEIIQSGKVAGNADEHLPAASLLQKKSSTALAQLLSKGQPQRAQLVEFLQGRAKKLGSQYLALVAERAAEDPFAKIKSMIKDLIVKLMEQANAEADNKAYCNTELATNKQTRENKAAEVEELSAEIDELTASSAKLAEELAELAEQVAELTASQQEATAIRDEEKATNAHVIADAQEGQTAVEAATKILREFYDSAADASLLQGGADALAVNMHAAPYKGMQSSGGGVFGMLEVILSDFARLEAEAVSSEDTQSTTYKKFMDESTESIAIKDTETEHKTTKKSRTDDRTKELTKEKGLTQEELDAALDYFSKLKAECVDTGLSYEERVRAREEEIQSLKEALEILGQQDVA